MNKVFLLLVATAFFAVVFTGVECVAGDDPPANNNANDNANNAAADVGNSNTIEEKKDGGLLGR